MSLAVSSWFVDQSRRPQSSPGRHLVMGGEDVSRYVLRWPTLNYRADAIDLGTTSVTLSNASRRFGYFVDSAVSLTASCELALSYTHPDSGEERISLFQGVPAHVAYGANGTEVRVQLQGKTQRLTDTSLGTDAESAGIDFSGSRYYPADLAWYLVTSHGGMSAIQSDANPDLNHSEWLLWRDRNVIRDTRVRAYLTGQKIFEVLGQLAIMDSVVISFQDAKLRFQPVFDAFGAEVPALAAEHVSGIGLELDPARLVNHYQVSANYNPATGRFLSNFSRIASESQARYGRRSGRIGNTAVWFDTADDGQYLAEDLLRFHREPIPRLSLTTPLAGGVYRTVGEVVAITNSFFGIADRPHRITRMGIDLMQGAIDFELEPARRRPYQFEAIVSSVNLWLPTLSAVASDAFLAVDETLNGHRVHRTDATGVFRPLNLYATALLALSGNVALFGGPPASGSTQSVMQRSSNAGSSATVVYTFNAGFSRVYDIFEVKSGTYLASTTSGGIYRSTNAGSSWSLTWTISGQYFINRFTAPASGRIWGGTGYVTTLAKGIYLWESLDQGVTWTLKHTVAGSGNHMAQGFYHVSASEHLLGVWGPNILGIRTFRSRQISVDSIAWTVVHSLASFYRIVGTASGHLLMGFDEETTLNGGMVYRSTDQGSSWFEDARIAKSGNVLLGYRGDGTLDAFLTRTSAGPRTDRYRNYGPDEMI